MKVLAVHWKVRHRGINYRLTQQFINRVNRLLIYDDKDNLLANWQMKSIRWTLTKTSANRMLLKFLGEKDNGDQ